MLPSNSKIVTAPGGNRFITEQRFPFFYSAENVRDATNCFAGHQVLGGAKHEIYGSLPSVGLWVLQVLRRGEGRVQDHGVIWALYSRPSTCTVIVPLWVGELDDCRSAHDRDHGSTLHRYRGWACRVRQVGGTVMSEKICTLFQVEHFSLSLY